jgi:hypothetical protein
VSNSVDGIKEFYPTPYGRSFEDIDMRIPSIYLPIDIELFDDHFKRFFEDFTHIRPDNLKHTLNQIKIGTGRIRYEVEFENLKPSKLPEPKRVICQIEAYVVSNHRIEIRAAALEINKSSWGETFLSAFYNMVYEKWGVRFVIPGLEELEDLPLIAARAKVDDDYGVREIFRNYPPLITSDNDDGNAVDKENITPIPIPEEISRRIDDWYNALEGGLPNIEAINDVPHITDNSRGPTLKTIERAEIIKKIKDGHPSWSQHRVAMEASNELGYVINTDTVRNDYEAMGWKWERADRAR